MNYSQKHYRRKEDEKNLVIQEVLIENEEHQIDIILKRVVLRRTNLLYQSMCCFCSFPSFSLSYLCFIRRKRKPLSRRDRTPPELSPGMIVDKFRIRIGLLMFFYL